jgi:hypothetical protein
MLKLLLEFYFTLRGIKYDPAGSVLLLFKLNAWLDLCQVLSVQITISYCASRRAAGDNPVSILQMGIFSLRMGRGAA